MSDLYLGSEKSRRDSEQMLNTFKRLLRPTLASWYYSQRNAATTREVVSNTVRNPNLVQYPYYLPRNSRGSLPVYPDIRNNGTRILVLIRNIEGNIEVGHVD